MWHWEPCIANSGGQLVSEGDSEAVVLLMQSLGLCSSQIRKLSQKAVLGGGKALIHFLDLHRTEGIEYRALFG